MRFFEGDFARFRELVPELSFGLAVFRGFGAETRFFEVFFGLDIALAFGFFAEASFFFDFASTAFLFGFLGFFEEGDFRLLAKTGIPSLLTTMV